MYKLLLIIIIIYILFSGVGKRQEKWDSGQETHIHSDGEVDESSTSISPSATTHVCTPNCDLCCKKSELVWKKRPDFVFDVSDGGTATKFSPTDSNDKCRDSTQDNTSNAELSLLTPTVRRESRLSRQEASAGLLFAEQRSRTPLKSSLSHDDRHLVEPEVPIRIARRSRGPREVICRSVGEEMTDNSNVGLPFLGTIRESNITAADVSSAGDNRAVSYRCCFFFSFDFHISK